MAERLAASQQGLNSMELVRFSNPEGQKLPQSFIKLRDNACY
jgi:hypothetical protein